MTGKDAHFYGARDTHATAVVFLGAAAEMARRNAYGTYDFFVRQYWERTWKNAPGYPMSRRNLGDMQDLLKGQILAANTQIQTLIPPDLKPYKETSPRTPEKLQALKDEQGDNLFVKQIFSEQSCMCARYTTGPPAPGCEQCGGSGSVAGKVTKCKTCAKHRLVKPHASTGPGDNGNDKWSCDYCTDRTNYNPECIRCGGKGVIKGMVDKWCIRGSFNPNSHDQIKRYVQSQNHTIPKSGLGRDGIAQLARSHGNAVYNVLHQIKTLEAIAGATAPLTAAAGILSDDASDVERIETSFMFMDADYEGPGYHHTTARPQIPRARRGVEAMFGDAPDRDDVNLQSRLRMYRAPLFRA